MIQASGSLSTCRQKSYQTLYLTWESVTSVGKKLVCLTFDVTSVGHSQVIITGGVVQGCEGVRFVVIQRGYPKLCVVTAGRPLATTTQVVVRDGQIENVLAGSIVK